MTIASSELRSSALDLELNLISELKVVHRQHRRFRIMKFNKQMHKISSTVSVKMPDLIVHIIYTNRIILLRCIQFMRNTIKAVLKIISPSFLYSTKGGAAYKSTP